MAFGVSCLHCGNQEADHEDSSYLDEQQVMRVSCCPGYDPRTPIQEVIEYLGEVAFGGLSRGYLEVTDSSGETISVDDFPSHERILTNLKKHQKGIRLRLKREGVGHLLPTLDSCLAVC